MTGENINMSSTNKTTILSKFDSLDSDISGFDARINLKANTADVVPNSRTVCGKALSQNITLSSEDISDIPASGTVQTVKETLKNLTNSVTAVQLLLANKANKADVVPTTRTVNGKALSTNITLTAPDVGAATEAALQGYVPNTRKINGKILNADITLAKGDVGLSSVDNTSDLNKPISTATQTALNNKANSSDVVALTGDQTVAGAKTFSDIPVFSSGLSLAGVNVDQIIKSDGSWSSSDDALATTAAIYAQIAKTTPLDSAAGATKFTFNNQPIKKVIMRQTTSVPDAVFNIGTLMQANEFIIRADVVSCPATGSQAIPTMISLEGTGTSTVVTAYFEEALGEVVVILYADIMVVDTTV